MHPQGGASGVPHQAHRAGAPHPGASERVHGPANGLPPGVQRRPHLRLHVGAALLPGNEGGEVENTGTRPHQDISCISFVVQDSIGGLEVLGPEGDWEPVEPVEGSIVVNIGDVVQVLSNDKFRSVMHRVVRKPAAHRYSLVFFLNIHGDKWVEPLPQFAADVGEAPRYSGFKYGDYLQLRARYTKAYQLSRPVDVVDITHYAI
ncbi:hypothetical protein ACQ4PT_001701 [Festuca glaucescens]